MIRRFILILTVVLLVAAAGCSGDSAVDNPPDNTSTFASNNNVVPAADNPSTGTTTVPSPAEGINRVDVVYFHATQRCVTCLCFEEHINTVMDKYFQDALRTGKLTYKVMDVQKAENSEMAKKYGAVGSQLFVNVKQNGSDNITDLQEIWDWKCRNMPLYFEQRVKDAIETGLNMVS